MDALATPEQLGFFLQSDISNADQAAALMLQIASGMVRDYLQQTISSVTDEVVVLDPIDGAYVLLPELPISGVSLVETTSDNGVTWSTSLNTYYTVSTRQGIISAVPNCGVGYPSAPGTWRVTYSHGYAIIPDGIVGVVLGVAARAYSSPAGVDSERIGGYQVKYSMLADGFSVLEKATLNRYMVPRVA